MDYDFWEWALRTVLKDTTSSIDYWVNGEAKPFEYNEAIKKIYAATAANSQRQLA